MTKKTDGIESFEDFYRRLKKDNDSLAYNGKDLSCEFAYDVVLKFHNGNALKTKLYEREKEELLLRHSIFIEDPVKSIRKVKIRTYEDKWLQFSIKDVQHIEAERNDALTSQCYSEHWEWDYDHPGAEKILT